MIKILCLIIIILVIIRLLIIKSDISLLADAIRYAFESLCGYRDVEPTKGFYNEMEMNDFSKIISRYFTAITGINLRYDKFGWQFAEFEIVPLPSGNSPGMREAITIEARNYIRMRHGLDNPGIIVPILSENFLCVKIPCSKKAAALAQTLDFSELPKTNGCIDETIS